MRRWSSRLAVLAAIGVVTAVSGCGADRGAGESAGQSVPAAGSGSASAISVTPDASVPPPGPVAGSGTPAPIVQGEVSVPLDAGGYAVGKVIRANVSNGMDRPVYTEDFKTACSIVILQRRDGGAWSDIQGCRLGRPTATVEIGPGLGQAVELDPSSFHLNTGSAGPAFGAGTYRVKFTYRVEPGPGGGADPLTAYSPEFTIR
jgi:hypothetical protein